MEQDLVALVTRQLPAWTAAQTGRSADSTAVAALNAQLGGRIPAWYRQLIATLPLGGLRLDIPQPAGASVAFQWATVADMERELLYAYPGVALWPHGYLVIGIDPTGSGDPFIIHGPSGPTSPVYQVPHDAVDDDTVPDPAQFWLVAPSVGAFVATAEPAR